MPIPVAPVENEKFDVDFDAQSVFARRPEFAVPFSAAISSWSWTEYWFDCIRSVLEFDCDDPDFCQFKSARFTSQQIKDLRKAMARVLSGQRLRLCEICVDLVKQQALERHPLAHGIVGFTPTRPKHILLFEQAEFRKVFQVGFATALATGRLTNEMGARTEAAMKALLHSAKMYSIEDLVLIATKNARFAELLRLVGNLCSKDSAVAASAEKVLLLQREVLAHL